MTDKERTDLAKAIADLVFERIRSKAWLYWPPGPMTSQIFDRDQCLVDVMHLLERQIPTS